MEQESITRRIDHVTTLRPEQMRPDIGFPQSVKIELTARCDLRCYFCATATKMRKQGDMDPALLRRLLLEMKGLGVKEVGLFYLGESFLVEDLPQHIRFAKEEAGIEYVFLTTNGRMATPGRLRAVIDSGLDSLKFSINAGTPETYRRVTRVDAFDKVISHLKFAHEYRGARRKPGLFASSILTPENREELERLRAMILPFVDEHYYLPLYNQGGHVSGMPSKPVAGNIGRIGNLRPSLPCWAVFTEGHITYDGRLSACCFDHDGKFAMGDLTKVSLQEAWDNAKFVELRRRHLAKDVSGTVCENCLAYQ